MVDDYVEIPALPAGRQEESIRMSNVDRETEEPKVITVPVPALATHPDVSPDVVSDPARADRTGADWADEGGASEEGPATHSSKD